MQAIGVVAAAAVVAFAGCPRSDGARLSKKEYEQRVQTLYAEVQSAFRGTRGTSGADLGSKIALAQKALRHMAGALRSAKPPREIEEDNRELTEALQEYASGLDVAIRAAASGDQDTMARFQDVSTHKAVRKMAEAAERMKHKGYDLGAIAKE